MWWPKSHSIMKSNQKVGRSLSDQSAIVSVSTLHLRIISGTDLPKPRGAGSKVNPPGVFFSLIVSKGIVIDPYVLIEVFGAASDCAEHRTRTIHNCGRNPVFDETCEFRLTVPGRYRLLVAFISTFHRYGTHSIRYSRWWFYRWWIYRTVYNRLLMSVARLQGSKASRHLWRGARRRLTSGSHSVFVVTWADQEADNVA